MSTGGNNIYDSRIEMHKEMGVCQRRYHIFLNGFLGMPLMCPTIGSYPHGERLFDIPASLHGRPKLKNIRYRDERNRLYKVTHYDIKNLYYDTADFSMRIYPDADENFTIPVTFRVELKDNSRIGGSMAYSDLLIHNDYDAINFSKQFSIFSGRSNFILHILSTMIERCSEKILNAMAREIQEECTPYNSVADTIFNIRNMIEYDSIRLEIDRDDNTQRVEKYIATFIFNSKPGVPEFIKVREIDEFSMLYDKIPVTLYYSYCSRNSSYNKCYKKYPGFDVPQEDLILNEYNAFNQQPLYNNGKIPYVPEEVNVPGLGITIPNETEVNNFVNYGSYTAPTVPATSFNIMNELEIANVPIFGHMNNMANKSRGDTAIPSVLANLSNIPIKVIYNNVNTNNNNNNNNNDNNNLNREISRRKPVPIPSVIRRRGKSPKRASNTNRGLSYNTRRREVGAPVEQYIPAAAKNGRRNNNERRKTIKNRIKGIAEE